MCWCPIESASSGWTDVLISSSEHDLLVLLQFGPHKEGHTLLETAFLSPSRPIKYAPCRYFSCWTRVRPRTTLEYLRHPDRAQQLNHDVLYECFVSTVHWTNNSRTKTEDCPPQILSPPHPSQGKIQVVPPRCLSPPHPSQDTDSKAI